MSQSEVLSAMENNNGTKNASAEAVSALSLTSQVSNLQESEKKTSTNNGSSSRLYCGFSKSDFTSILILFFLYFLQGIPLGMMKSIPYLLQARKASYASQGDFSISAWPFSMKLLWAPLVDSIYWPRLGRRKSWLIPSQFCIAIIFLLISTQVTYWIGDEENDLINLKAQNASLYSSTTISATFEPSAASTHVAKLTAAFFVVTFLTATQDVAVDGWAITMLSRENVGWGATCNNVGQTAGRFVAFFLFIGLESAEFCNKWLRSKPQPKGIITFSGFLIMWGILFAVSTTLVLIFKRENPEDENPPLTVSQSPPNEDGEIEVKDSSLDENTQENKSEEIVEETLGPIDTYKTLWKIIMLRPIQGYICIMILMNFTFTPFTHITELKLLKQGVPRESVALMEIVVLPMNLLVPLIVSRYTNGSRPLSIYFNCKWVRLYLSVVFSIFVYFTPRFFLSDKSLPFHYFIIFGIIMNFTTVFAVTVWIAQLSFHTKISDPKIGGTYITLLNTLSNLSTALPITILLYLLEVITQKTCHGGLFDTISCNDESVEKECVRAGGQCVTWLDGYYLEVGFCVAIGIISLVFLRPLGKKLERLSPVSWMVTRVNTRNKNKNTHVEACNTFDL